MRPKRSPRGITFSQDESGEDGHPEQVHHACDEEQRHQNPAAADAVQAVFQPHQQRAGLALAPFEHHIGYRRAAAVQADFLEFGKLEKASGNEDAARQPGVGACHLRGEQGYGLHPHLQGSEGRAEGRPDQDVSQEENRGAGDE